MRIVKYGLIGLATLGAVAFVASQVFWVREIERTEHEPYEVISSDGDFEIRYYPGAVEATTIIRKANFDKASNRGFRVLAGYIFGKNDRKEQIAMTAPVKTSNLDDGSMSMTFVMPESFDYDNRPTPMDSSIEFTQTTGRYAAVWKFGGAGSEAKMQAKSKLLVERLEEMELDYQQPLEYLRYNPPFQLVMRRNEVLAYLPNYKPE